MRFRLSLVLIFGLVSAAWAQAQPGPVGVPAGPWRMQIHWVPLDIAGTRYLLYTRICRPAGEQPARVVVIAHGSPAASRRSVMTPIGCDNEAARWFLDRGFVVLAGMRRGFGQSAAPYAEGVGGPFGPATWPCDNADYFQAGLEAARDLAAMVEYAASLPFARLTGMILVGQSAGGWATIAYNAMPHARITAVVNMAGGRGGHLHGGPNDNCHPERLAEAAGRLARTATTPMLWVYTANDSYFAPPIAAAMYAAYTQSSGRAEFEQLGPFGQDGHRLFFGYGGSQIWGPLVERYLATRPQQ